MLELIIFSVVLILFFCTFGWQGAAIWLFGVLSGVALSFYVLCGGCFEEIINRIKK